MLLSDIRREAEAQEVARHPGTARKTGGVFRIRQQPDIGKEKGYCPTAGDGRAADSDLVSEQVRALLGVMEPPTQAHSNEGVPRPSCSSS